MARRLFLTTVFAVGFATLANAQTIERRPLPMPGESGAQSDPAQNYEPPVDPNAQGTDPFFDRDDPFAADDDQFGEPSDTMVAPDASDMGAEISQPAPAVEDRPIKNPVASFTGIDKITGRIHEFDVYIDETVQFGALLVTPRVCISRPESLEPKTDTFVEIDEMTLDRKVRRIFTGWMFAESPGLNAVEHAVYDVWLKGCKQETDVPAPSASDDDAVADEEAGESAQALQ